MEVKNRDNDNQQQQGQQEQQEQQGTNAAQLDIAPLVEEIKAYRAENAALRESVESLRKAIQASNRAQGGASGGVTAEAALKKFFN